MLLTMLTAGPCHHSVNSQGKHIETHCGDSSVSGRARSRPVQVNGSILARPLSKSSELREIELSGFLRDHGNLGAGKMTQLVKILTHKCEDLSLSSPRTHGSKQNKTKLGVAVPTCKARARELVRGDT